MREALVFVVGEDESVVMDEEGRNESKRGSALKKLGSEVEVGDVGGVATDTGGVVGVTVGIIIGAGIVIGAGVGLCSGGGSVGGGACGALAARAAALAFKKS